MSNVIVDCTPCTAIKTIQVTWTDLANVTRCIYVTPKGFESNYKENGVSLAQALLTMPYMYDSPAIPVKMSMIQLMPDPETRPLPLPWLEGVGLCFGKFIENGLPCTYCPRSFLAKQEKLLEMAGLQMKVGFELEFFLMTQDGTALDSCVFGETKAVHGKTWKLLSRIVSAMESCGIPIWRYHVCPNGFVGIGSWNYFIFKRLMFRRRLVRANSRFQLDPWKARW